MHLLIAAFHPTASQAEAALGWYSGLSKHPFLQLVTAASDASLGCPAYLQAVRLARGDDASSSSSRQRPKAPPPVFAYRASHPRVTKLGALADGDADIDAILGVWRPQTRADSNYIRTMQDMFFRFVHSFAPEWYGSVPAHLGYYAVGEHYKVERTLAICEKWKNYSYLSYEY